MNRITSRTVIIDIETLPSVNPEDVESRARKIEKGGDEHARTALSGDFGRILCIRCSDKVGDGKGRASRLKLMCENQLPPTTLRRDH